MARDIVYIANPAIGGKTCTSMKSAGTAVYTGRAVFLADGRLWFFTSAQRIENRNRERERRVQGDRLNGVVCWNGSDRNPVATHRPGEARS